MTFGGNFKRVTSCQSLIEKSKCVFPFCPSCQGLSMFCFQFACALTSLGVNCVEGPATSPTSNNNQNHWFPRSLTTLTAKNNNNGLRWRSYCAFDCFYNVQKRRSCTNFAHRHTLSKSQPNNATPSLMLLVHLHLLTCDNPQQETRFCKYCFRIHTSRR